MKVLAILRAEQYSPNSVEKDKAIMTAVAERLRVLGHEVTVVSETRLPTVSEQRPELILSMGRHPETLRWMESQGVRTVNTPKGIARCQRSVLQWLMKENGVPVPPDIGSDGYWLKRGDGAAQTHDDVVFAADENELKRKKNDFHGRGIDDYTVSAHVVGDVVKFYGVLPSPGAEDMGSLTGKGFFRHYYPTDDGVSKFGDEQRNGIARHYEFMVADLQQVSERLAAVVGVDVYGGDCIVRPDGTFCIIDFNDWPSFSRCMEEAADAIVRHVTMN